MNKLFLRYQFCNTVSSHVNRAQLRRLAGQGTEVPSHRGFLSMKLSRKVDIFDATVGFSGYEISSIEALSS